MLKLVNRLQVCHLLAFHGEICGYPRTPFFNKRAAVALPALIQLLKVENLDGEVLITEFVGVIRMRFIIGK